MLAFAMLPLSLCAVKRRAQRHFHFRFLFFDYAYAAASATRAARSIARADKIKRRREATPPWYFFIISLQRAKEYTFRWCKKEARADADDYAAIFFRRLSRYYFDGRCWLIDWLLILYHYYAADIFDYADIDIDYWLFAARLLMILLAIYDMYTYFHFYRKHIVFFHIIFHTLSFSHYLSTITLSRWYCHYYYAIIIVEYYYVYCLLLLLFSLSFFHYTHYIFAAIIIFFFHHYAAIILLLWYISIISLASFSLHFDIYHHIIYHYFRAATFFFSSRCFDIIIIFITLRFFFVFATSSPAAFSFHYWYHFLLRHTLFAADAFSLRCRYAVFARASLSRRFSFSLCLFFVFSLLRDAICRARLMLQPAHFDWLLMLFWYDTPLIFMTGSVCFRFLFMSLYFTATIRHWLLLIRLLRYADIAYGHYVTMTLRFPSPCIRFSWCRHYFSLFFFDESFLFLSFLFLFDYFVLDYATFFFSFHAEIYDMRYCYCCRLCHAPCWLMLLRLISYWRWLRCHRCRRHATTHCAQIRLILVLLSFTPLTNISPLFSRFRLLPYLSYWHAIYINAYRLLPLFFLRLFTVIFRALFQPLLTYLRHIFSSAFFRHILSFSYHYVSFTPFSPPSSSFYHISFSLSLRHTFSEGGGRWYLPYAATLRHATFRHYFLHFRFHYFLSLLLFHLLSISSFHITYITIAIIAITPFIITSIITIIFSLSLR